MAIGLGQMLIGGLLGNEIGKRGGLSGLLGNVNKGDTGRLTDQQMGVMSQTMPTQSAQVQAPQQQTGGFMQGISNMLGNPTDAQIARMGMGFNSMRLRPDANLAASFQKRIDASTMNKSKASLVAVLKKQGKCKK